MNPTLQQVLQWVLERKNNPPGESMHEHIANRAAEWSAAQSTERIAAIESANAKQAARIAELEDELEKLEKQPAVGYSCEEYAGHGSVWDGSKTIYPAALVKPLPRQAPLYARPVPARTLTDGWQPIETAPKDGKTILVWFKPHGAMSVCWTDSDGNSGSEYAHWHIDDHKRGPFPVRGYLTEDATHWMPLPAAPEVIEPTSDQPSR